MEVVDNNGFIADKGQLTVTCTSRIIALRYQGLRRSGGVN